MFDKDQKSRHIIDILCRKSGAADLADVEIQEAFDLEVARAMDRTGGMAGLLGKSALPKISVDLFIIDWESPKGGAAVLIKTIKAKYSGNFRFLVVADKRYAGEMGQAMKAGATDCILKPFTASEFKEKLDNVLSAKPMTISSYSLSSPVKKQEKAAPTVTSFSLGSKPPEKKAPATPPAAQSPFAPPQSPYAPAPKMSAAPPPGIVPKLGAADAPTGGKTSTGGPSFYTATKKKVRSEFPTATLVDGKIDGHYHEKVDVIGGGENCYWAREIEGDKVRLEYLSAKGKATGIEAKVIDRDEFMFNFYLCHEHGCHILRRLGQWPPPQQ